MKFRVRDLENYFSQKLNWKEISEILTDKAFESSYNNGVLEVDILANRYPDASSFVGLAQEIAALIESKIKYPIIKIKEGKEKINQFIKVKNKTAKTPFYFGRVILGVKNDKSPTWLKELVESYGFNSVNFIVDLSNFVMLEFGAPLHVFDLDKIKNKEIIIREAQKGEKFIALNNNFYSLQGGEILITDNEKILALAGIIGSKEAEVDLNTKNIFIEAAVFDPATIYKTSRSLKITTEASYRFERMVIPQRSLQALERLSFLIQKNIGGKVLKGRVFLGKIDKTKPIEIDLKRLEKFLGISVNFNQIKKFLSFLRIKLIKRKKDRIQVLVPEDRIDLKNEEDIYEEILRLYGVNNPKRVFEPPSHSSYVDESFTFNYKIKTYLKELGFSEVYGYNLISIKDYEFFKSILEENQKPIEFLNPLSENYTYFEFTLLPNLLKSCSLNQKRFKDLKIFRLEKVAYRENNEIKEFYNLCLLINKKEPFEILKELKTTLNYLLAKFNINSDIIFESKNCEFSDPFALGFLFDKEFLKIGLIKRKLLEVYDIDYNVGFMEINLNELKKVSTSYKRFEYWGDYPEITRDLSFYISKNYNTKKIIDSFEKLKIKNLKKTILLDIYFPHDFPDKKSLTFKFIFQSPEKTLTEEEVEKEFQKIKEFVSKTFEAQIR